MNFLTSSVSNVDFEQVNVCWDSTSAAAVFLVKERIDKNSTLQSSTG